VIEESWARPDDYVHRLPTHKIHVWYIDEFMLSLNLARIRTAQERFEFVYEPEAFPDKGESFGVVAPIKLAFDIYKDRDQFRLVGGVQTTLELMCSRCLEPFALPIDASFDLRYHPHALNTGEGEREVEEDDLTTAFYENETIDLGQLMAEQFYLALPMKPLCSEGCKGLCPTCGTNLNRATCTCTRGWEDPRFAVLKKLKAES
jgi:uncharacterized protein